MRQRTNAMLDFTVPILTALTKDWTDEEPVRRKISYSNMRLSIAEGLGLVQRRKRFRFFGRWQLRIAPDVELA